MGFITTDAKTTNTPRPGIPSTQKVVSSEYNDLTGNININYQEFLDLKTIVDNLPASLPYVEISADFNITSKGIYVFKGSTDRTFTIDDAIEGDVIIRTVATADLTLSGNINSAHMGVIYQGSPLTAFLWSATESEYTF